MIAPSLNHLFLVALSHRLNFNSHIDNPEPCDTESTTPVLANSYPARPRRNCPSRNAAESVADRVRGPGGLAARSSAVMESQSKSLARLKVLILGLTAFLLVFSVSGFVLLDVYLLSSVSETRLKFLDRTLSYFQSSIKACISLRSMHLERNMSHPSEQEEIAVRTTFTTARMPHTNILPIASYRCRTLHASKRYGFCVDIFFL